MEEIGMTRTRSGWLALLVTAGIALAPTAVWGQNGVGPVDLLVAQLPSNEPVQPAAAPTEPQSQQLTTGTPIYQAIEPARYIARGQDSIGPADPVFPIPTYSPRPEMGGFFVDGEFLYWRQTNPLKGQTIAIRGFVNTDGGSPAGQAPGTFNGSGVPALDSAQVSSPSTYVPGYRFGLGYRFSDGLVVEGTYAHLFNARYVAAATLLPPTFPPNGQLDPALANTFLFSPVFNFTTDWAGPNLPIGPGLNPLGNFGIWNGASEMRLRFDQHLDRYELRFRVPVFETDYDPVENPYKLGLRCYGLWGLRHTWLWERFQWATVKRDAQGNAGPTDQATYSNILSQPLYGPFVGWGGEIYYGHGTALSLDVTATAYLDFVRELVRWERADRATEAKRSRRVYTIAPEAEAHLNFWWYPIEGIEIRVGYDVIGIFNTIASPHPVDFNFNSLTPDYTHQALRLIDGWNVGIGFIF
jgi:hypothetical protein